MTSILVSVFFAVTLVGDGPYNFETVTPTYADGDQRVPDIWTLKFVYRHPRYIMVDIPGKGRRLIWYMRYKIINETGKPREIVPQFTLVTDKGDVFEDTVIPAAQMRVIKEVDPTLRLHNSVTISKEPIPVTPSEGLPVTVEGICFWDGGDKLMSAKSFDIFVTGLSNGYVKVKADEGDSEDKEPKLLRKTLRLQYTKPGDLLNPDQREISRASDEAWLYR